MVDTFMPMLELRAMKRHIRKLEIAIKPFARIGLNEAGDMIDGPDLAITPKDVKRAREALGDVY